MCRCFSRAEEGTIVECAVVALPLFTALIAFIWIAVWLTAIAQITQESVFASTAALAKNNTSAWPGGNTENMFINHGDPMLQQEAYSLAKIKYGLDENNPYHLWLISNVAGSANDLNHAYGLTDTQEGIRQLGADFTDPTFLTVNLKMASSIITAKARVLYPLFSQNAGDDDDDDDNGKHGKNK